LSASNTILVVDDEPSLRLTLGQILNDAGYMTSTAADGREALAFLGAGPYNLAFLDLNMPEMDGMSLLREIRRLYPDMPVLILTGHATLESAVEAVRYGANDYLFKPINPSRLLARIHEILAEQRQPQRRREIVGQIQNLLGELQQFDGAALGMVSVETSPVNSPRFLQRGRLTLDLQARQVMLASKVISLPGYAFDYLVTLMRHAPDSVPYQTLVFESQGLRLARVEAQETTRWWVYQLRKVLEPKSDRPEFILTVRGIGYRFADNSDLGPVS
jgi:DNA-binding response OmpR family regulator